MTMHALQAFARECVSALAVDGVDASVIRRRYGLEGLPEETLESVSKDMGCTRENVRLRQIKALTSLNKRYGNAAANLVEQHVDEVWSQAVDGVFVTKALDLTTGRRSESDTRPALSGEYLLAWDVTAGKPRKTEDWLNSYAQKIGAAWFDRRISSLPGSASQIAEAAGPIKQSLDKPIAIESLARQLDSDPSQLRALLVAAFPKDRWDVHAGYIRRTGFTIRSRRAVQLHRLMVDCLERDVADLRSLGRVYREHVASDPCTDHDLVIVIGENPQLFLQVGSGYWAPIGQTGLGISAARRLTTATTIAPEAELKDKDNAGEAPGLAERIETLLLERGPQRLVDLYSTLERQGVPRGSVVGTIGQNTRFIRILPGTYALDQQLQAIVLSRDAEALFNEKEVLGSYVRARFAGESFQRFPLWSWVFEYQMALWAERHESALLPELLAVSQPENWPAPGDEIDRWKALKLRDGNYRVGKLPQLKPRTVSAREVLAALLLASKRGCSSVVTCSLIMKGDGIDSSVGSALLMLLVATGAVSSGETWQSPHPVTDLTTRWAERLGEELANTGTLDWSSPAASTFLGAAGSSFLSEEPWFRRSDLENLLLRLTATQSAGKPPTAARARAVANPQFLEAITAQTKPLPAPVAESIITNEELRIAAHAGDLEAQYQLGIRTASGDGARANPVMAVYWLRMAANSGHLAACHQMTSLLDAQGRTDHAEDYRRKAAAILPASARPIATEQE